MGETKPRMLLNEYRHTILMKISYAKVDLQHMKNAVKGLVSRKE